VVRFMSCGGVKKEVAGADSPRASSADGRAGFLTLSPARGGGTFGLAAAPFNGFPAARDSVR